MIPLTHFYMIRHGETEANATKTMAGSLDSPLTENGRAQARAVQPILETLDLKPQAIVHSHLSRARDTALILNETLNAPMNEDPDLAEMHAGDWEGAHYDECRSLLVDWIDPPGGETCADFFTRIRRGKKKALENPKSPVLIVSHGGVFRALGKLFGLDTPGIFRNCHLYEFMPAQNPGIFPWDVFHYEYNEGTVTRAKSYVYAASEDNPESDISAIAR